MTPANLLVLMSDEHNPKFLGAAGHPFIATPNLDALAARGTRFTSAYTACPICVPARASFAVGRYVHDIGYWDNADGYDGAIPSWHHALRDAGHRVVSIGKLHFRGRKGDDHGFSEEIVPMHIIDGIGDVKGLIRERIPKRKGGDKMARKAGPGESPYTVYDREIASRAQIWLHEEAPKWRDRPWVLFVSFVAPHFPLTAPARWFYRYWRQDLPLPKLYERGRASPSSVHRRLRAHGRLRPALRIDGRREARHRRLQRPRVVDGRERGRRAARACATSGLEGETRVLYTSDHGDNAGARGLWGKSTFYEESAGVPLIVAGPGVPAGRVVATPVSHIDCAPTILEATGAPARVGGRPLPGASLFAVAEGAAPARPVISEYHAIGSTAGAFMLRFGKWKYCHYVAYPPQLFDLEADPEELADLAGDARFAAVARRGRTAVARGARSGRSRRAGQAAPAGSCSKASVAATRRWRAATWVSRRRRAPRRR